MNTGEDAIAIKSGLNKDGETVGRPSEYIVVRSNEYLTGKGSAATLGSDMSGGVRCIFFLDNHSLATCNHLQSISLKTNGDRAGTIEQLYISGLKAAYVEDYAVYAAMEYKEGDTGETVNRMITVRYSCGALESRMETCWYESDAEDGEYIPVSDEGNPSKMFHGIMEEKLMEIDPARYDKLGIKINREEYLSRAYHAGIN